MSCNKMRHAKGEKGSSILEFLLCLTLIWIPLFLGLTQYGLALIQAIRVSQACRDTGRMFAYGIDFSQTGNKYLLADTAPALNLDPAGIGGSGVVILSTVQYVTTAQCQAGGYASTCPNNNQLVFIRRIVIGNPSIHTSAFGAPTTDSNGNVIQGSPTTNGYLNQPNALVSGFPNISLASGTLGQQYSYICEVYTSAKAFTWFLPGSNWVNDVSFF